MTSAKDESEHKLEAFEVFVKSLSNEVNKEDVYKMIEVQTHMHVFSIFFLFWSSVFIDGQR